MTTEWRNLPPTDSQIARLMLMQIDVSSITTRGEAFDILRQLMAEDEEKNRPTSKQINLLRELGYKGTIKSKGHAGLLIRDIINSKKENS